jgi:hypothetical protein
MTVRGKVQGGVIVPEAGSTLPEGTDVVITTVEDPGTQPPPRPDTLSARLMKYAGALSGLPKDLASNHDHYIHGTPRK